MVFSAAMGFVREMLVAYAFGTSLQSDAFFFASELALSIPDVLTGGMVGALIPLYAQFKREGNICVIDFTSTVVNFYLVLLVVAMVAVALVAPLASAWLAPGFDQAGQALMTHVLWMLAPLVVLAGLWQIFKAFLEAERRFLASQFSTVFLALGVIGAILVLRPWLGIYCLPVGLVVGGLVQVVWAAFWLRRQGFVYCPTVWAVNGRQFRRFLRLLVPGIVGGLIGGVIPVIDKSMASALSEGSVASLSFAGRPVAMATRFGLFSLITALLPTLAWNALEYDRPTFRLAVSRLLGLMIFLSAPLAMVLSALRVPIIQVLFEHGAFDAQATAATSELFGVLILGMIPLTIASVLATIFKSIQDPRTPALLGGGSNLVSKVVLNLTLIGPLGVGGIALATALQHVVSGMLLLFLLRRRLGGIGGWHLAQTLGKVALASLGAYLAVVLMGKQLLLPPLLHCVGGLVLGAAVYGSISLGLRTRELTLATDFLLRRRTAA